LELYSKFICKKLAIDKQKPKKETLIDVQMKNVKLSGKAR